MDMVDILVYDTENQCNQRLALVGRRDTRCHPITDLVGSVTEAESPNSNMLNRLQY